MLSAVVPRLLSIGFKFSQPYLLIRIINFIAEQKSRVHESIGNGLIGACIFVYIGIAVS